MDVLISIHKNIVKLRIFYAMEYSTKLCKHVAYLPTDDSLNDLLGYLYFVQLVGINFRGVCVCY